MQLRVTDMSLPPDSRKQRMAMPPNYVHSLDSTHMMLTALHCQRLGAIVALVNHNYN